MDVVFWDVRPCGCCEDRRFGGMSVLTRLMRRHILEDGILQRNFGLHQRNRT
jgi:hypothetical protein